MAFINAPPFIIFLRGIMLDTLSSYLKKYFSEPIIRAIFVTIPFQKYNIEGNAKKFLSLCLDASILISENFRCVLVFYAFCFEFSKLQLGWFQIKKFDGPYDRIDATLSV